MNKKGFTLVELIISIALLSLIGISIGTTLNKSYQKNQKNEYDEFINKIESSANVYASADTNILNQLETSKGFIDIEAKELIDSGILSTDLVNPKTGNKIQSSDKIRVTLDDNGTLKFEFNPSEAEEYLIARSIIIKAKRGTIASCFNGDNEFNTSSLMHVLSDGNNANDLTSNTIKCTNADEISKIDTTKIGTYEAKLSYKTTKGVWKSAIRKVLVVDGESPIIKDILVTEAGWNKDSAKITANITDNDLLGGYCLNLSNDSDSSCTCSTYITTDANGKSILNSNVANIKITKDKSASYYICAKDRTGNSTKSDNFIVSVDQANPLFIDNSTKGYSINYKPINITIKDDISGLKSYYFTASTYTNPDSIPWKSVSTISGCSEGSKSCTLYDNSTATSNKTYHLYLKDVAGRTNVSDTNSVSVVNVVAQTSTTFSNEDSSSYISTSKYIRGAISISGTSAANQSASIGSITSASVNNGTITVSGYATQYDYQYTGTCTDSRYLSTRSPDYYDCVLDPEPCPYGGYYSGGVCQGNDSYTVYNYSCYCVFNNGSVNGPQSDCDSEYTACKSGYHRDNSDYEFYCDTYKHGRVTSYGGEVDDLCYQMASFSDFGSYSGTKDVTAIGTCYMDNYDPSCTEQPICYSGVPSGNYCTYCTSGSITSDGYNCSYDCTKYITKYHYNYTVWYYYLK
jgi:prepilin-type N-terminal cleavage/methylation domain-containing protein